MHRAPEVVDVRRRAGGHARALGDLLHGQAVEGHCDRHGSGLLRCLLDGVRLLLAMRLKAGLLAPRERAVLELRLEVGELVRRGEEVDLLHLLSVDDLLGLFLRVRCDRHVPELARLRIREAEVIDGHYAASSLRSAPSSSTTAPTSFPAESRSSEIVRVPVVAPACWTLTFTSGTGTVTLTCGASARRSVIPLSASNRALREALESADISCSASTSAAWLSYAVRNRSARWPITATV